MNRFLLPQTSSRSLRGIRTGYIFTQLFKNSLHSFYQQDQLWYMLLSTARNRLIRLPHHPPSCAIAASLPTTHLPPSSNPESRHRSWCFLDRFLTSLICFFLLGFLPLLTRFFLFQVGRALDLRQVECPIVVDYRFKQYYVANVLTIQYRNQHPSSC